MPKTFLTVPRSLAFAACSLLATAHAAPPTPSAADGDSFLRDYAETRGFMLGRPVNATPTPDGSAVLFLRAKSSREPSQELYEFSVASGQTRRLLSPEDALNGSGGAALPGGKIPPRTPAHQRGRVHGVQHFQGQRARPAESLRQALRARPRERRRARTRHGTGHDCRSEILARQPEVSPTCATRTCACSTWPRARKPP